MTRLAVLASAILIAGCRLPDANRPAATPQRPTVSYDTSTTALGTFELETGVAVDPDDFLDTPNTLKYGTADNTELFVGWSPWQRLSRPGPDGEGGSDVTIGARHRVLDAGETMPSAALVIAGKLPTASTADGLGSGEVDLRVGGILNRQLGPVNANVFYQYGALGDPSGSGTVSEHTATVTAGLPLTDRVAAFAEVAGIFVPSWHGRSVFTIVGATFAPGPAIVLDAGVTVGLSDAAPDLQLFVGCTYNFGR
ncbi:MAG: hypothetical protein KDE27_06015 [Planctomycetes bacterium]|nr:hypothetical protein [Planctomycetota bacterium]